MTSEQIEFALSLIRLQSVCLFAKLSFRPTFACCPCVAAPTEVESVAAPVQLDEHFSHFFLYTDIFDVVIAIHRQLYFFQCERVVWAKISSQNCVFRDTMTLLKCRYVYTFKMAHHLDTEHTWTVYKS